MTISWRMRENRLDRRCHTCLPMVKKSVKLFRKIRRNRFMSPKGVPCGWKYPKRREPRSNINRSFIWRQRLLRPKVSRFFLKQHYEIMLLTTAPEVRDGKDSIVYFNLMLACALSALRDEQEAETSITASSRNWQHTTRTRQCTRWWWWYDRKNCHQCIAHTWCFGHPGFVQIHPNAA